MDGRDTSPTREQGAEPGVKKKRRRIHLNCEECRRTKSKCGQTSLHTTDDRQPFMAMQRVCQEGYAGGDGADSQGMAHICPNQVSKVTQPKSVTISELTTRVKHLEDALRRNGLTHELQPLAGVKEEPEDEPIAAARPGLARTTSSTNENGMDMAATLARLALDHVGTKRYAGMGTTAFYLSSPSASEDENSDTEDHRRRNDAELWRPPWGRWRGVSLTGRGHLPGALLDRCRAMLCSRRAAKDMFDKFFEVTAWRLVCLGVLLTTGSNP